MNEKQANRVFEKYNAKSDIVRCPRGRAPVRKELDLYARGAVNLYGIIPLDQLADIFNEQSQGQTSVEEIYTLLLPLVVKDGWYGFYKDYLVHYWFFDDFDQVDYLLRHQGEKPRYIPEKEEFLQHALNYVRDNEDWQAVRSFMVDVFDLSKRTLEGYREVKNYLTSGDGINELGNILDRYNLVFTGEEQFQEFINLIMLAKNNTRIWENKGYTPSELFEMSKKKDNNIIEFPIREREKVGRNDPCPCGSGKKYKKCCAIFEDKKSAQLSTEECRLFYETWYGLMGFVNEKKNVIRPKIKPEYPNAVSDVMVHKVREVLWEEPELIDDYIKETQLNQEKIEILKLWKNNHKKGMFLIMEYQTEFAVLLATNQQGEDRLYGVKGISTSLANAFQRDLPTQAEGVLLPFKGKIIYDSFMSTLPIEFGKGAKEHFSKIHQNALKHGIITKLE